MHSGPPAHDRQDYSKGKYVIESRYHSHMIKVGGHDLLLYKDGHFALGVPTTVTYPPRRQVLLNLDRHIGSSGNFDFLVLAPGNCGISLGHSCVTAQSFATSSIFHISLLHNPAIGLSSSQHVAFRRRYQSITTEQLPSPL
jgi:hypothetical protein